MISNSSKYALRAVLFLAANTSEGKKILAKDISGPTKIPQAYLSKLMQDLSRHKLISSTRGPGGGFYLTAENRKVTLMEIIAVIDGDHRLRSCILSLDQCDNEYPCPMHHLVGNTKTTFLNKLEKTTVQDLVVSISEGKSYLPLFHNY